MILKVVPDLPLIKKGTAANLSILKLIPEKKTKSTNQKIVKGKKTRNEKGNEKETEIEIVTEIEKEKIGIETEIEKEIEII